MPAKKPRTGPSSPKYVTPATVTKYRTQPDGSKITQRTRNYRANGDASKPLGSGGSSTQYTSTKRVPGGQQVNHSSSTSSGRSGTGKRTQGPSGTYTTKAKKK